MFILSGENKMAFTDSKIIAAVRREEQFENALLSKVKMIFLLRTDILSLPHIIARTQKSGKKVFVHLDMADGIGKDRFGVEFLKKLGCDGIISTKNNLIAAANSIGLSSIQRYFIIDSQSIFTALESIRTLKPQMAEIMPGVATKAIARFKDEINIPLIAGGLLESREDIALALSSGAAAVSTSKASLWNE